MTSLPINTASGESQSMSVRFLVPPRRTPMLHGSSKSRRGVLAAGRFGLPSGDLWAFCGMPVFVGDWKRVQSQFLVVLKRFDINIL